MKRGRLIERAALPAALTLWLGMLGYLVYVWWAG
jgi:hypothetical protein